METSALPSAQPTERCNSCYKDVSAEDAFCQNCGYPLKGTAQEQSNFRVQKDFRDIDHFEFNAEVRKAANSLYYLSAIFVISGLIVYVTNKDSEDAVVTLILNLVLAMIFLALGGYARKKPLACIISGLALYAIVVVLNAIIDPVTIIKGLIMKIIIVGFLIKGLKAALEIEKMKKENQLL
ncbi:MAG TPA: hypothetical protein VIM55_09500 [Mucilaginibacter sp.]